MKKIVSYLFTAMAVALVFAACKKDKGEEEPGETKTQLLTKSTWKFDKATASGMGDVSSEIDECITDNLLTFTSTVENAGAGVIDEGDTKCSESNPQTIIFTWTLENSGNTLISSEPFFTDGSTEFTVITLNATSLVVSQEMTFGPLTTTVTVHFKH